MSHCLVQSSAGEYEDISRSADQLSIHDLEQLPIRQVGPFRASLFLSQPLSPH